MLDAIDLAYLDLEHPLVVLRVPGESTQAERKAFIKGMREMTDSPIVLLPPGYDIEVIGPRFSTAPPLELARWADDGGPV